MSPLSLAAHLGRDEFLAQVYHRHYLHVPGALPAPRELITWDDLNTILATNRMDPPRLRLSMDSEMLPQYRYSAPVSTRRHTVWQRLHPAELHARLTEGASLVIDAVDELHPAVGRANMELEQWLRTGVQTNLYASWTAKEGFGVHWDDHDVVVAQVDGSKRWKIFGPTRTAPMYKDTEEPEPPPEKPLTEIVMRPGDLLYLPRGWWHSVAASEGEHSLHLTFGIQTTTGAQLLSWLADDLRRHDVLRLDLPVHAPPEEQADYLKRLKKEVVDALGDPALIGRFMAARDAEDMTRMRPSLPHINSVPAVPGVRVSLTTARADLAVTGDGVTFRACGNEWDMATEAEPLLRRLLSAVPGSVSLGELADAAGVSVDDAAQVITELVGGQAVAVEGGAG
ncbi:cupin domain-containing protein [Streptomyces microflavus]|uniref:cupin domain-containing protein n=1 Tax=Streptomyces microflavus TaxID=1919 RepID=UPI00386CF1F9|nr:cupin domain-containing protein [Streptomyces microflavus]